MSAARGKDAGKVTRRRTAGLMSLIVGIPNFILAVLTTFGGIAVTIALGLVVFGLLTDGGGDDPWRELCIVLMLILFIALLIAAVIFTIISLIFAICVGGQTIGGWYAYKGTHYSRSVALTLIGSIVSLCAGVGLLGFGAFGDITTEGRIGMIVLGMYEIAAFAVTLASFIMIIGTKETFKRPDRKQKKGKKKKKKK